MNVVAGAVDAWRATALLVWGLVTLKNGGQVVMTVTSKVSKDGKTRTSTFKGKDSQGNEVNNVVVLDKQ